MPFGAQSPSLTQAANLLNMNPAASYNALPTPQSVPPQLYQAYLYQMYQQNSPNMGTYHA